MPHGSSVQRYGGTLLTARPDTQADLLAAARSAYRNGDWETSYAAFSRAGAIGPLSVDDLDAMAGAAWRSGHDREAMRVGELVYIRLTRTDPNSAATKAVELGTAWLSRGDVTVGHSWIRRARGLLAGASDSSVLVRLTYLETVVAVLTDDEERVAERSAALREVSTRVPQSESVAIDLGDVLDERRLAALGRALEGAHSRAAGQAYYQLGEVRRRRGDVDGAMAAYARAFDLGVVPQPGEALLRCSLGDVDTAWAEIKAAIAAADERARPGLLHGAVEIALARGDVDEAEHHFHEFEAAGAADPLLRARLLIGLGRFNDALAVLRAALREYRLRGLQHQAAEAYRWMAAAHRGLGADDLAAADEAAAGLHVGG
jgi:tetratricopeptide (TPR) repeat protein